MSLFNSNNSTYPFVVKKVTYLFTKTSATLSFKHDAITYIFSYIETLSSSFNWILVGGRWDDDKFWVDEERWNDG